MNWPEIFGQYMAVDFIIWRNIKLLRKKFRSILHWFKYEAYFTWLSGFCLLFVVYYFNASAMLIDKNVLDITPWQGVGIGVGSFIVAWIMYDLLVQISINKKGYLVYVDRIYNCCWICIFLQPVYSTAVLPTYILELCWEASWLPMFFL